MDKERGTVNSSSYFFRLNQELSGQAEINPYYEMTDGDENVKDQDTVQDGELAGSVEEGQLPE